MCLSRIVIQWFINRSAMDNNRKKTNSQIQKWIFCVQSISQAINDQPLLDKSDCELTYSQDILPVVIDDETAALLEFAYRKFGKLHKTNLKNHKALRKEFVDSRLDLIDFAETCYINSVPGLKEKILENDEPVEVDWKNDLKHK